MSVMIPMMPKPDQRHLRELASIVGVELPASYIEFVHRSDGAVPESNSFDIGPDNMSSVRNFISVELAPSVINGVDGFPAGALPFAEDDCGNFVYIDPSSGKVLFWDHEVDGPDVQLASSLPIFLDGLVPFDPSTVRLAPGQVKSVWVASDFKPEF